MSAVQLYMRQDTYRKQTFALGTISGLRSFFRA
jgi:hypothetical protein